MGFKTISFTREKIYEEVWSEPATTVAGRYGITSTGLAKICRRLSVPLPPRGYWAKAQAGKKVSKKPLPPFTGPTEYQSEIRVDVDPGAPSARKSSPVPGAPRSRRLFPCPPCWKNHIRSCDTDAPSFGGGNRRESTVPCPALTALSRSGSHLPLWIGPFGYSTRY